MKGGGKERSYCLPECSYLLFICEMKDKPLLYLPAWKQGSRLYYSSPETFSVVSIAVWEEWWGVRGLTGIHIVGHRARQMRNLLLQPRRLQITERQIETRLRRLTFRRQVLVTTCLGSTTSTRGSLIATLRMQLMSNPYTFSHPVEYTQREQWHIFFNLLNISLRACQAVCRTRR